MLKQPMRWTLGVLFSLLFTLSLVLAACATPAPDLEITGVWGRPSPQMAGMGAVYMQITNKGSQPDRLLGAECPVAATVEVHETVMEGDVMKMNHLPDGLEIPAKGQVELKPGGYHLMLIDLTEPLQTGEITCLLQFETSGQIEVTVAIRES